jgi:AcrR family transcriptional regulator
MFQADLKQRKPRLNREEQKAERIRQLLEAAWAMYARKGYEAVTIDDVAEYAGVSRMPVYSLFGDKQNLYFELWCTLVAQLTAIMIGPLRAGVPLRRNLEQLARVVVSGSQKPSEPPPEGLFFVVQTIALSRPDIAAKLQVLANKVVSDVAEMVSHSTLEAGEELRASPQIIAAHLVAHINGMSTVEFQTHGNYRRARDLIDIFHAIAFKSRGR